MSIEQQPFVRYNEEKKSDTFTVKLNAEERTQFEEDKHLIQQEKDSTAMKQLAEIGAKVLRDEKTRLINSIILNNYRKNKRMNVVNFD